MSESKARSKGVSLDMRIARLWFPTVLAIVAIVLVVLLSGCGGGSGGGY
jgi:hypothetical protein